MSQDNGGSAGRGTGAFRISAENFDENYYLQQNPDVATAILFGEFASAYDHYVHHGWREQRAHRVSGNVPSNRVVLTGVNPSPLDGVGVPPSSFIESLIVSRRGGIFLVGWIDDRVHRLERVELVSEAWRATMDEKAIARVRRRDVEQALSFGGEHPFGFWSVLFADQSFPAAASIHLRLCLRGGLDITQEVTVRVVSDLELRETALGYLAQSQYFGNFFVETVKRLEPFVGTEIVRLNRAISHEIVATPYVERFGSRRRYKGSIIVCLYGKPEYLPLQNCLFSGRPGIEDYEFIYVSNSPDISEQMFRDARTATRTYGLDQSLVILPGNAGFGAANNCAAALASSDRLLIVNPDVFPVEANWAAQHTELTENLPGEQTRFFGAPLYYDDGSLMHAGMYFELDKGISLEAGSITDGLSVRVEHFGKGAPPETERFLRPHPVPAITGAFMSIERAWYESLGGFTEDYVFGHYEDADLCLKSLRRGYPSWLHPLRMWHLEGKGSKRLPVHEGGSLVNRWLFSQTWVSTIQDGLEGPAPAHEAFVPTPAENAERPRRIFKVRSDQESRPTIEAPDHSGSSAPPQQQSGRAPRRQSRSRTVKP